MIYLDNCATTKMRPEVAQKMYESACEDFGNPSSLHRLGMLSEKKITEVRQLLANELGVSEKEIYFTSGGTEGNNLALIGAVRKMAKRGTRILTTKIEHPSVLNPMRYFEEEGFEVCYLNVDSNGRVDLDEFQQCLNKETILVSVMQVNNEIGTLQPLKEIGEILSKKRNAGETSALFHIDGVQGFMKVPIRPKELGADFYTASAHKIHGPKGVGLLYIRKDLSIPPLMLGGGQEREMRPGTENVQGILGFGIAASMMKEFREEECRHAEERKKELIEGLKGISDIRFNTPELSSPYILNVSFQHVRGEVLVHYLEAEEIYVSTTSACSSKGHGVSHVLSAIGTPKEYLEGTIRMCVSHETTSEDIHTAVEKIAKYVEEIRKIMKR